MVPSLPALLGTNKFSSIWGTATAAIQYQRRVRIPWRSVLPASLVALAASFLGARAAVHLNPQLLRPLIFFLLVAVAIYTYWKKDLGALHAPDFQPALEPWLMAAVGLVIGFYDGFFGPGTGSFLIFIFIGLFGFDFLTSSASAKVINFATNLSAVIYFAWTDHILYRVGIPMAVCNVLGALTGARLAISERQPIRPHLLPHRRQCPDRTLRCSVAWRLKTKRRGDAIANLTFVAAPGVSIPTKEPYV